MAANVVVASRVYVEIKITYPIPSFAPINSPTIAPKTASVAEILRAGKI